MLLNLYTALMTQLRMFRREEHGAVDVVAVVVLIGIAVALAVIFKDRIKALLETLFGTIESNATTAIE